MALISRKPKAGPAGYTIGLLVTAPGGAPIHQLAQTDISAEALAAALDKEA